MPRSGSYHLTDHERALVLAWSQAGIGPAEQARRLGRKPTALHAYRRALLRANRIAPLAPPPGRAWTKQERERLIDLVEQGYSYTAIAKRLKRSRRAVILKAKRLRCRRRGSRAALTALAIADLLGLSDPKMVSRWIRRYGLRARNAGRADRPIWQVQWEDLCAWLEDPAHWMAYDPARCGERTLREHLIEIRAGQSAWLRVGEVARRYHVTTAAVGMWIWRGLLPATRFGNWWVRESDLIGWLPPCERPRRRAS